MWQLKFKNTNFFAEFWGPEVRKSFRGTKAKVLRELPSGELGGEPICGPLTLWGWRAPPAWLRPMSLWCLLSRDGWALCLRPLKSWLGGFGSCSLPYNVAGSDVVSVLWTSGGLALWPPPFLIWRLGCREAARWGVSEPPAPAALAGGPQHVGESGKDQPRTHPAWQSTNEEKR